MSVKAMRRALVIFLVTGLVLLGAALLLLRYAVRYPDRPLGPSGRKIALVIPPGSNFPQVVRQLTDRQLIHNEAAFRVYVNYKGLAAKIRAGTYTFPAEITPRQLLNILVHGVPAPQVTVLIPEGKNMLEVAEILAGAGIAPRDALVKQMRNKRFLVRIGATGNTIEGYLFPDTYKLRASSPPQEILAKLCARHHAVYATISARQGAGLKWLRKKLAWGKHEIVTLASIVEKETGQKSERPLIAGVFLNRLTLPGFASRKLETDPTIVYGCTVPLLRSEACKKFAGRIRRIHLEDTENPYNTYTHSHLPPGPIANPGRQALEAVLAPQRSRYIFFVSKNDGTHQFSASRSEHEAAVDRYQRRRKAPPSEGE